MFELGQLSVSLRQNGDVIHDFVQWKRCETERQCSVSTS